MYPTSAATFQEWLGGATKVVVLMHARPDGDAMGAGLAVGRWCRAQGALTSIISPTPYPSFLSWLPGRRSIVVASQQRAYAEGLIAAADLLVCVDFSSLRQLGSWGEALERATGKKVVIDHHLQPESWADLLISDPSAASTTLMLYEMMGGEGAGVLLDRQMATLLYVGLVTDTGNFLHSNTTPRAHQAAAALLKRGVEVSLVSQGLYGNQSLSSVRFLGHALSYRLVVREAQGAAYFAIPGEDIRAFNLQAGDTAGLVHYALNLKGVSFAALLTEQWGLEEVRVSLRSVGTVRVDELARAHFGGGGHPNAAGGVFRGSLTEAVARLEEVIAQELPGRG